MKVLSFFSAALIGLSATGYAQSLYLSGGAGGILNSTNGNIGIGTNTPATTLDVNGTLRVSPSLTLTKVWDGNGISADDGYGNTIFSIKRYRPSGNETRFQSYGMITFVTDGNTGTERMRITADGHVGIGTTTPWASVHLVGNSIFSATNGTLTSAPLIRGNDGFSTISRPDYTWMLNDQCGIYHPAYDIIGFVTYSGGEIMRVTSTGLSIGSIENDVNYRLSVKGTIRANEIKVYVGWADFVFNKQYKLMPLGDVETYIKENHHLPEIPSAKQVEKDGVCLGEMQAKMLQKIEELTLHLIDQNKKIEALQLELKESKIQK